MNNSFNSIHSPIDPSMIKLCQYANNISTNELIKLQNTVIKHYTDHTPFMSFISSDIIIDAITDLNRFNGRTNTRDFIDYVRYVLLEYIKYDVPYNAYKSLVKLAILAPL